MVDPVRLITPVARAYAWGSRTAIPQLLGVEPTGEPVAELWYGAHPHSPSLTAAGPLDAVIAADPGAMLGAAVAREFDRQLPFLLKVLAAGQALSIQVHPNLRQAAAGFAAEQAQGIAADAPNRNYRDANHKPELLCALTDFDALCGFRPVPRTVRLLEALDVAELAPVLAALGGDDPLRAAFELLLDWPAPQRAALIAAVLAGCRRLESPSPSPSPSASGEWASAARSALLAAEDFPDDIGVVLTLLLNSVRLAPGEAIFLGAGNVHAYLRGLGVEIMANSDNVLRCGLTPKHVDVGEVLRIADFSELADPRCRVEVRPGGERVFDSSVRDFSLSEVPVPSVGQLPADGPQILLCVSGTVVVEQCALRPGQAVFATANRSVTLSGVGVLFRATVGSTDTVASVASFAATEANGPAETSSSTAET